MLLVAIWNTDTTRDFQFLSDEILGSPIAPIDKNHSQKRHAQICALR
jgi:hypothetical protein